MVNSLEKINLIEQLQIAQNRDYGDWGRNRYLLNRLKNNQNIFNSDRIYLSNLLGIPVDLINTVSLDVKTHSEQKSSRLIHTVPNCLRVLLSLD